MTTPALDDVIREIERSSSATRRLIEYASFHGVHTASVRTACAAALGVRPDQLTRWRAGEERVPVMAARLLLCAAGLSGTCTPDRRAKIRVDRDSDAGEIGEGETA